MDERLEAVRELLRRWVEERARARGCAPLLGGQLERIELRLGLDLRRDGLGSDTGFEERLKRVVDRQLDEALDQARGFLPGHAFCYRCRSVTCEHSVPPQPRAVLVGYAPTGMPVWRELAQYCLEIRHPRVDRLYGGSSGLVAVVQSRQEVAGRMIQAFRKGGRELFGQLVAGMFRVEVDGGRSTLALTWQILGRRRAGRVDRLDLNLIGIAPEGLPLEGLWEHNEELPWRRAARWAEGALETVRFPRGRRVPQGEIDARVERRALGILAGMARRIEHSERSSRRRTLHARVRHTQRNRPTEKAVDDARAAARDAVLVDRKSDTIVVLGERGRTHFFTKDGRLVSSVRYSRDAISRKLKLELWVAAREEQVLAFREHLPD